jgi:hypothetical protein
MELITFTFDRVFDLHRYSEGRNQKKHTLFSFSSDIGTQYGVSVPGWPKIEPGDTVTAILSESSNWQTLRGWANHRTKEVAVYRANEMLAWIGLSFFCSWLFYIGAFSAGGGVASGIGKIIIFFISFFSCVGVFGIFKYVQQIKVCKALNNVLREIDSRRG